MALAGPLAQSRPMRVSDLERSAFFQSCDDPERAALATIGHVETVPAGVPVLVEGLPADVFRVVLRGSVGLAVGVPSSRPVEVGSVGPDELLGWSSLLPGRRWVATARALEPTELLAFPAEALLDLCDKDPRLGARILGQALAGVADRLDLTRHRMAAEGEGGPPRAR